MDRHFIIKELVR